ncbi:hypothetical protein CTEN210_12048 [Chaetoceros tenuissimus]|uniref:Uncharacterized protein n=1 Tax=Chaetoceros tenuissimus TaxID=426638 RepID=A0AAD3D0G3_9STRA|nr:hypothetical protein CTEN210_12048 [Chaetoceros tenuissimus]
MSSGKQMNKLQEVREQTMQATQVNHNRRHEAHASPSKKVSNIDGIGLWNSFTRSFKSPLMACFDLIDNVFDASSQFQGRLNIDVDVDEFEDDDHPLKLDTTNGFYILNSCQHPVKPMTDVLTVFNSDKGSARSQIGENGVGVKQGCATLSDINFVMSRNENVYSLGILARTLQKKTGPYIPSFDFQYDSENDGDLNQFLMLEITAIVSSVGNEDIAAVMKEYGHGDVEKGKYRLIKNMMRMNEDEWSEEKYVFCICVHDLKHGHNNQLIDDMKKGLPEHYLHVPQFFQVWFEEHRVKFNHWPNRLANLTRFNVRIPKDQEIDQDILNSILNRSGTDNGNRVNDHSLNIYLGFDAIKIEEKGQKAASLYFYSRKFGRLIKSENDGRGMLWLSAGSTNYCQALTIIVDDISGALPLNPTKQDFAFGEHDNGQVWKQNLLKWVSAVTKVYYNYYLMDVCKRQKKLLTDLVKSLHNRAKEKQKKFLMSDPNHSKAIDERRVSTFEGLQWDFKSHKIVLTPSSKKVMKYNIGEDIDLFFDTTQASNRTQPQRKNVSNTTATEEMPEQNNAQNGDDERCNAEDETYDQDMTLALATATATAMATTAVKRARREPIRYGEYVEPDEEEEQVSPKKSRTIAPSKTRRLDEENAQFKQENAQLKQENAQLKQELEGLREELRDANIDMKYLEDQNKEKDSEISKQKREINRLKTRSMDL